MTRNSPAAMAIAALALFTSASAASTDVSVAPFNSVELRGGGQVVLSYGPVQRVTLVSGSSAFTTFDVRQGKLEINACNDSCPHRYDLSIAIVTPQIAGVAVKGGGEILGKSGFPSQRTIGAAVMGGGMIDIRSISADAVSAAVNGGGHIKTTPTKSLQAAVHGGGEITYSGNPAVTSAVAGGGSVSRQ